MRPTSDDSPFSTHQRLQEIARILAAGILRLRDQRSRSDPPKTSEKISESAANCLELPHGKVLSGHHGLTVSDPG